MAVIMEDYLIVTILFISDYRDKLTSDLCEF